MSSPRPIAIIYQAHGGPDYEDEWFLYPPAWDDEYYEEIDVDLSGWVADLEAYPIDGPFESEAEAKAALKKVEDSACTPSPTG